MIKYHRTICNLLSCEPPSTDDNHSESDLAHQIPAVISYYEKNIILEIKLIFSTSSSSSSLSPPAEFIIPSDSLSQLYISGGDDDGDDQVENNNKKKNQYLYLPLTSSTPYLDITLLQFQDRFMIQIGKYHIASSQRKIAPNQFYGKSHLKSVFSIFPRQELAFQFYDEHMNDINRGDNNLNIRSKRNNNHTKELLKIFSFEAPLTGKRKFLVCDLNTFHEKYRCNINRHVYEIIREGYPCRLYFDIEYSKETNPEINGESIIELWISLVIWKLYIFYGLLVTTKHIIHLDSSTEKKFSRHLIFLLLFDNQSPHLDQRMKHKQKEKFTGLASMSGSLEYLFVDNLEVGNFVFSVLSDCLTETVDSSPPPHPPHPSPHPPPSMPDIPCVLPRQFRNLHVKKTFKNLWLLNSDQSSRVCVVDVGVYTRNRAFRLLSSTKYGKNAKFEIQKVSEAKQLKSKIPYPLEEEEFQFSTTAESVESQGEDHCWYLTDTSLWSLKSSEEFKQEHSGSQQHQYHHDQERSYKKRCFEKIITESTTNFNYFVRLMNKNVPSSLSLSSSSQLVTEILERTFVIPATVTSPQLDSNTTSFRLLPSLERIISTGDSSSSPSLSPGDSGVDVAGIRYCLSCGQPLPSPRPNPNLSCPTHCETLCFISFPQLQHQHHHHLHADISNVSSSQFIFPNQQTIKTELVKIEEILTCKKLSSSGQCQSPFPVFDDFVRHIASLTSNPQQHGPLRITQFSIRSTLPISSPQQSLPPQTSQDDVDEQSSFSSSFRSPQPIYTITYQITGTRYCHRIGRHHKSNNVMFEANLNQGCLIQKCWDPDCRGFKSSPFYLPHSSLPSMNEIQEIIGDLILTNSIMSSKEV